MKKIHDEIDDVLAAQREREAVEKKLGIFNMSSEKVGNASFDV